ncbi:MAG: vitamin K epoxide reductase family protein [Patescibacteria group bacterium]
MRILNRDAVTRSEVITGLAVLGFFFMSYLTWVHFRTTTSSLCDLAPNFSCDTVNKSVFSTVLGIPLAILGQAYFLLVGLLPHIKEVKKPYQAIALLTLLNAPFALSLSAIELFYLGSVCVFCEFSKVLMLGILALSVEETNAHGHRLKLSQVAGVLAAGTAGAAANFFLTA